MSNKRKVDAVDVNCDDIRSRIAKCKKLVGFEFSIDDVLRTITRRHDLVGQESRLLRDFIRFMCLKTIVNDQDATLLSPTPLIDEVWQQVILNTTVYSALQKTLKQAIHHRPEEDNARVERLQRTLLLWTVFFKEKPLEIPAPAMAIVVRTFAGKRMDFSISPDKTVAYLKLLIQAKEGVPPDQNVLIIDGKHMEDADTLSKYPKLPGSVITMVLNLRGC